MMRLRNVLRGFPWLVLGFISLLTKPGYGAADFVLLFVKELGIGLLVGVLVGSVGELQAYRRV